MTESQSISHKILIEDLMTIHSATSKKILKDVLTLWSEDQRTEFFLSCGQYYGDLVNEELKIQAALASGLPGQQQKWAQALHELSIRMKRCEELLDQAQLIDDHSLRACIHYQDRILDYANKPIEYGQNH